MDFKSRKGNLQQRIKYLRTFIIFLFLILLFRGWHMQIIKGSYYKKLAENNRIRSITIHPFRGIIYDRNGEVLARNVPSFNLGLIEEDIKDMDKTIKSVAALTALSEDEIKERIETSKYYDPFSPVIIKENISMREVALIESLSWKLPGVIIVVEGRREYPFGSAAAHVLGYVGEITREQLRKKAYDSVPIGSIIGQSGIEKVYDSFLRGKSGIKNIEVDAAGHERRVLDTKAPVSGDSLILTLDINIQKAAEKALGDREGAIVVMESNTGEILALASHPSFDPNVLSRRLSWKIWRKIAENPAHPLTNRAIQGIYPPGSIFKIVMASAGLEEHVINPRKRIYCGGKLRFGNRTYRDWKLKGHGYVNLYDAIVESCDVYFYQLGLQMDIDTIAQYAHLFGLGEVTEIDLPSEKKGLVPTKEWKHVYKNDRWYPGETISVSIGQGFLSVTPLQQTVVVNAIANSGYILRPKILKGIMPKEDERIYYFPPVINKKIDLKKSTFKIIKKSLRGVVYDRDGTARIAKSNIVEIAGKTGTAQVVGRRSGVNEDIKKFTDHAWFTGFAPFNNPEIIVTVLVEHGGHGGSTAAPLVKDIIEEYYRNKKFSRKS